jgi:hypothetical protein
MPTDANDLNTIVELFDRLAARLLNAEARHPSLPQDDTGSAALLIEAMQKVFQLLKRVLGAPRDAQNQDKQTERTQDMHELGDYGFNLLSDLATLAARHGEPALSHEFEGVCLPLAVWIARQGGSLSTLEPIVNALAYQANTLREPRELQRLYETVGEIQDAVTPLVQKDLEKSNPNRPWRILLLNRAIIATRSHRPELMETAYENLVMHLPEEAPRFFREGMQQMVALDYPQPVRKVVEKYYNLWSGERTLH